MFIIFEILNILRQPWIIFLNNTIINNKWIIIYAVINNNYIINFTLYEPDISKPINIKNLLILKINI